MVRSLKDGYRNSLALVLLANVAVFVVTFTKGAVTSSELSTLQTEWQSLLPGGLVIVLTVLLNGLISADMKARLVFWQWENALPSSRVFSRLMISDVRIDRDAVERSVGALPTDPADQSRLWYKLYQSVKNEPEVLQNHKEFLFMRDWCSIAALVLLFLGIADLIWVETATIKFVFFGGLVAQYLLTAMAARIYGNRFVTTVLAVVGAGV